MAATTNQRCENEWQAIEGSALLDLFVIIAASSRACQEEKKGSGMLHHHHPPSEHLSLLAVDQYRRFVRQQQAHRLSVAEEEQLFALVIQATQERCKPQPDAQVLRQGQQARDHLVESLQPLVMHMASVFLPSFRHVEWMDLVQEGNEALLRFLALDQLYAVTSLRKIVTWYLRKAMIRVLYTQESLIRVREGLCTLAGKILRVQGQLYGLLHREPSWAEVAAEMQLPMEEVLQVVQWHRRARGVLSLEVVLSQEREDGLADDTIMALVGLSQAVAPASESSTMRCESLRVALSRLAPRQRELICRLYGLGDMSPHESSPREVAQAMGIRESSINQIEWKARKALARQLRVTMVKGRSHYDLVQAELEPADYYSVAEVSEKVGCRWQTVYRLVQEGKLTGVVPAGSRAKMVVARAEVEALLAQRAVQGESGRRCQGA